MGYAYDKLGRIKTKTDGQGDTLNYAYDNEDRLIRICQKGKTGEEDRETFYERDPLGQVECIRDVFGNEEHYSYDALGRTIMKTDRDGYRTGYDYTADGKIRHISYGDGTSVEMEYTALRQLALVKDWLGETRIERNMAGDPVGITDHNGKTVSYEWGSMGERKGIIYPDGRKVRYCYDGQMRLEKMRMEKSTEEDTYLLGTGRIAGRFEEINYRYDVMGRISEKLFPEGMRTRWHYNERGQLVELVHEDSYGILDRYQYEYDPMGNKTSITKERKGLKEESGRYEYRYDALSRLTSVSKDGDVLRSYAYDSFGNRSYLEDFENERNISYHYDSLNRLKFTEEWQSEHMLKGESGCPEDGTQPEKILRTDYVYDNRGNLIREGVGEKLIYGYEYGAMNRLTKSWNGEGQKTLYWYNGFGQRMGKNVNGNEEDYILDLTKSYRNLLGVRRDESEQYFYFDGNISTMEESRKKSNAVGKTAFSDLHYYLQDELGSPIRVSGFRAQEGTFIRKRDYLTYGYDEFGNDLGRNSKAAGISQIYNGQGIEQPFGYTGYCYDEVSGTYFAQAREYQPRSGRFTAEDVIKGNGAVPSATNQYVYCLENPVNYIDKDGKDGYYFYDPFLFDNVETTEKVVSKDKEALEEKYDTEIHLIAMNTEMNENYNNFQESWKEMDDSQGNIEIVVVLTHSNNGWFVTDTGLNKTGKRVTTQSMHRENIINLVPKNIDAMYLLGCNMGLSDPDKFFHSWTESPLSVEEQQKLFNNSLASTFYAKTNRQNIGMIIASDGTTVHNIENGIRVLWTKNSSLNHYHDNREHEGFKKYYIENGVLICEPVLNMEEYMGMALIQDGDSDCGGKKNDKKYSKKK